VVIYRYIVRFESFVVFYRAQKHKPKNKIQSMRHESLVCTRGFC
jgi:hypothetical protein